MEQIAFIGAGNMASAMIKGLLSAGHLAPVQIACTSAADGSGERLARETGIRYFPTPDELVTNTVPSQTGEAGLIVLAIKPQQLKSLPDSLMRQTAGRVVLSILAGTPLRRLALRFPDAKNIIRAMPNTPGQIGAGITCYAARRQLSNLHREFIEKVLGALGPVIALSEKHLDGVTAVSGSGPAYVFEIVAALRNAGIRVGLEPGVAYQLALETVLGAARLLSETGRDPEELRDAVTSPNGTTKAALEVLEKGDLRGLIKEAVIAAKNRSMELARESTKAPF